ncbi:MAG: CPBP family intramembrane glutamic endopeptidase [archaeon]|jgi:membrane protease YdiL (CAAX protease family)
MHFGHLQKKLNLKIDFKSCLLLALSLFIPFLFVVNLDCSKCIVPLDSALASLFFYGLIPLVIIVFLFREDPKVFGYSLGDKKLVLFSSIIFSLYLTPIILLFHFIPNLSAYYSIQTFASISEFILFELKLGVELFFWELFFRGFILFGLYKKLGNIALPIHAIPFTFFHLGKPPIEIIFSFIAALLLGQIALKSKSFLPAFAIHWIIATEMILLVNL